MRWRCGAPLWCGVSRQRGLSVTAPAGEALPRAQRHSTAPARQPQWDRPPRRGASATPRIASTEDEGRRNRDDGCQNRTHNNAPHAYLLGGIAHTGRGASQGHGCPGRLDTSVPDFARASTAWTRECSHDRCTSSASRAGASKALVCLPPTGAKQAANRLVGFLDCPVDHLQPCPGT